MFKVLAPVAAGVALGLGLLYISSLFRYDPNGCGGCSATGRPLFWTISATGYGGPLVNMSAIALDLVFWIAISLAVVEMFSHFAVPCLLRELKMHRPRQSAISKS
jgi:hypothetical protein